MKTFWSCPTAANRSNDLLCRVRRLHWPFSGVLTITAVAVFLRRPGLTSDDVDHALTIGLLLAYVASLYVTTGVCAKTSAASNLRGFDTVYHTGGTTHSA